MEREPRHHCSSGTITTRGPCMSADARDGEHVCQQAMQTKHARDWCWGESRKKHCCSRCDCAAKRRLFRLPSETTRTAPCSQALPLTTAAGPFGCGPLLRSMWAVSKTAVSLSSSRFQACHVASFHVPYAPVVAKNGLTQFAVARSSACVRKRQARCTAKSI